MHGRTYIKSDVKSASYVVFFGKWKEADNSKSQFIVPFRGDEERRNVGVLLTAVKWALNFLQIKQIYEHAR